MNSDGGPANRENETARIEAFSDGVFAIAITLLVIEIGVPHLDNGPEGTTLFGALIGQWPSYLGYVISFLQIGVVWANHHNRFTYIVRSDHIFLFLNILFLMCVAFIPFPTALLAEYIESEERTIAVAVYTGTLAVTAVCFTLLWYYAANGYRLVNRSLDPATLRAMTQRYIAGMVLYIVTFALTFVNSVLSLALVVSLALLFVLPEPGSRPRKPEASAEDDRATTEKPDEA
ncbi:MAG: potassium channel family protein [Rubrobacteraceae bacterium]|nr:potassium channel family protein [Rubrobacteraceae bacterium]